MAAIKRNTLLKEINPFITFFQIFGLQYFSATKKSSQRIRAKYWFSFLLFNALNIASFVLQLLANKPVNNADSSKSAVKKTLDTITFYALFCTASTVLIQSFIKTPKNKNILENFELIADISAMNRVLHRIEYKKFRTQFTFKLVGILIMFFMPLTMLIITDALKLRKRQGSANTSFILLPIVLSKFASIKFMFYADLINFHLQAIENMLRRPCEQIVIEVSANLSYFADKNKLPRIKNENLFEKISNAKDMYGYVWENTSLINDCLGWTTLILFILLSLGLVVNGYVTFTFYQTEEPIFMFAGK